MAIKKLKTQVDGGADPPRLILVSGGPRLPEVYKKIILALESDSSHPMARALREAYRVKGRPPPVGDHKHSAGVGVSGYIYGKFYCLGKDPAAPDQPLRCTLFEDDRPLFEFKFQIV